jgi:thimet oligopeptidase
VPSQLYEEWAWDPAVLARFARHHATGEPLPAELAAKLRAVEEFGKGLQVAQQMFYARLALAFHEVDPRGLDTTARMVELKRAMLPFPYEEGTHFQCSFGHLHGYSATYYTYMWSLVIAKDLFARFAGDPMDRTVAREYRAKVLAPGGARDAEELVEDFLGRPYAIDAWRRWLER